MKKVREITADEENFRIEPDEAMPRIGFIKRDPIEPEPIGTIVIKAFRVTGYDQDCDGSLMARLENIDFEELEPNGWEVTHVGLYPATSLVVSESEIKELFTAANKGLHLDGFATLRRQ